MFHFGRGLNLGREFIKAALQVRDLSIVDDAAEELALGNTEGFGGSCEEVVILFGEEAHGGAHRGWAVVGHMGAVWRTWQANAKPPVMFPVKPFYPKTPTNSRPLRFSFVLC